MIYLSETDLDSFVPTIDDNLDIAGYTLFRANHLIQNEEVCIFITKVVFQ